MFLLKKKDLLKELKWLLASASAQKGDLIKYFLISPRKNLITDLRKRELL